jgi:peptide-methionine (R)-S-oxide reductase
MKRRTFIRKTLAATSGVLAGSTLAFGPPARAQRGTTRMLEDIRDNWRDFLPESFETVSADEPVELSRDEWRERLDNPLAFNVLRKEATERPFTSALNDEKREGVFLCAGCDLPLFTSEMKFDSGTSWPSFFTTIPGAFETKRDFLLVLPRTEYHCARCGGHHGHVFKDGPQPTGERWCNNGVALRFVPKDAA